MSTKYDYDFTDYEKFEKYLIGKMRSMRVKKQFGISAATARAIHSAELCKAYTWDLRQWEQIILDEQAVRWLKYNTSGLYEPEEGCHTEEHY